MLTYMPSTSAELTTFAIIHQPELLARDTYASLSCFWFLCMKQ